MTLQTIDSAVELSIQMIGSFIDATRMDQLLIGDFPLESGGETRHMQIFQRVRSHFESLYPRLSLTLTAKGEISISGMR
jgi:hypothetical protein